MPARRDRATQRRRLSCAAPVGRLGSTARGLLSDARLHAGRRRGTRPAERAAAALALARRGPHPRAPLRGLQHGPRDDQGLQGRLPGSAGARIRRVGRGR